MKYSYINDMDIYNGPGVRVSLFLQGCQSPLNNGNDVKLNDFNNGKEFDKIVEDEIIRLCDHKEISGLTITGAEPFDYVPHMLNYHPHYYRKFIGIYNDYPNMIVGIVYQYYHSLSDDDLFEINPLYHLIKRFRDKFESYKTIWVYTKYPLSTLRLVTSNDKDIAIGANVCIPYIDVLVHGNYITDGVEFGKRIHTDDVNKYVDVILSLKDGNGEEIPYERKPRD